MVLGGLGVDWVSWPGADLAPIVHEAPDARDADAGCDAVFDAYLDWREALEVAEDAYRACGGLRGAEAQLAFEAYVAALDREERAAEVYSRLTAGARASQSARAEGTAA